MISNLAEPRTSRKHRRHPWDSPGKRLPVAFRPSGAFSVNSITLEFLTGGNSYPDQRRFRIFTSIFTANPLPRFHICRFVGESRFRPDAHRLPWLDQVLHLHSSSPITLDPSSNTRGGERYSGRIPEAAVCLYFHSPAARWQMTGRISSALQ